MDIIYERSPLTPACRKVWKSGGASNNVVGVMSLSWYRVNWSAEIEGGEGAAPAPQAPYSPVKYLFGRQKNSIEFRFIHIRDPHKDCYTRHDVETMGKTTPS